MVCTCRVSDLTHPLSQSVLLALWMLVTRCCERYEDLPFLAKKPSLLELVVGYIVFLGVMPSYLHTRDGLAAALRCVRIGYELSKQPTPAGRCGLRDACRQCEYHTTRVCAYVHVCTCMRVCICWGMPAVVYGLAYRSRGCAVHTIDHSMQLCRHLQAGWLGVCTTMGWRVLMERRQHTIRQAVRA